jgi:hypothetical protein
MTKNKVWLISKISLTIIFFVVALTLLITFTHYYVTYDLVMTSFLTKEGALYMMIFSWVAFLIALSLMVKTGLNLSKMKKFNHQNKSTK